MIKLSTDLNGYVERQLNSLFPDEYIVTKRDLAPILSPVKEWMEYCFEKINNKYFTNTNETTFSHLNSDQYAMALYMMSRVALDKHLSANLITKLYLLNKTLHGIDVYPEVRLPEIFLFVHPVGTVLGRANYSDYLCVYQKCGVGSNRDVYPTLGKYLTLHPGAMVLGNSIIGANVAIATESLVLDTDVENNSVYIGTPASHKCRRKNDISNIWHAQ